MSGSVRLTLVPPPEDPPASTAALPHPPAPLNLSGLQLQRGYLEHQLEERRWFGRLMLLFVTLALVMVGLAIIVRVRTLIAEDRVVCQNRTRVYEAVRVLRDLQAVQSHATDHPESYLILHRHQNEIRRQHETYNRVVSRYNLAHDLPCASWLHRWFNIPPQHQYLPPAE